MDGLLRLLGSVSWVLTSTGGGGKLPKLGKDGGGGGGNSTVVGAGPISAGELQTQTWEEEADLLHTLEVVAN